VYPLGLAVYAASPRIVATLDPADTDDLDYLAPEADGRAVKGLLVRVDAWAFPDQIGLVGLDELGALEQLPAEEGDEGCRLVSDGGKIACDEMNAYRE
jgi:hypothetical protein